MAKVEMDYVNNKLFGEKSEKSNKNRTSDILREISDAIGFDMNYLREERSNTKGYAIEEEDVSLIKEIVKKKRQGDKTKIILEYGGFFDKDKAKDEGIKLLRNVKLEMCRKNNPINISGIKGLLDCKETAVMPAQLTEYGLSCIKIALVKDGIISEDKIVLEDVLGLEIYEVKSSMDEIHFVAEDLEIKHKTEFVLERKEYQFWCEKLDITISFLNTSNLINDVRMKFLLKIMAIEVLVSEEERENEDYVKIIEDIMRNIDTNSEIGKRVKNDIGRLKIKSIGKKCKILIEKYCGEKSYGGLNSIKFFNKCYKMRSGLVHSGELDLNELGIYDEELKNLVVDIVENIANRNMK